MHIFHKDDLALVQRVPDNVYPEEVRPGDIITVMSEMVPTGAIYNDGGRILRVAQPSYEIHTMAGLNGLAWACTLKPLPSRDELEDIENEAIA